MKWIYFIAVLALAAFAIYKYVEHKRYLDQGGRSEPADTDPAPQKNELQVAAENGVPFAKYLTKRKI